MPHSLSDLDFSLNYKIKVISTVIKGKIGSKNHVYYYFIGLNCTPSLIINESLKISCI